ncbi:MAG: metallophosphoesterase [Candidatus Riflebacteria bacterium]|nr:metallophosphoesterase [Candidatus Riflebacteria bacterium]
MRLAHFSDIHVTAQRLGWRSSDWFNKRLTGWVNLRYFGRGRRFAETDRIVQALMQEVRTRRPDHVIFSGDATALGFEEEMTRASRLVIDPIQHGPGGMAVPGNHDTYTEDVAGQGFFERHFAPWQIGTRLSEATYPFAQRVGPIWLIGVNSSTGNFWPWDAAGSVGPEQLQRLETLLKNLEPGPRILVIHHPMSLPDGSPEDRWHGLRDLAALVRVAANGGVCLALHGHHHRAYHLGRCALAPFPAICAGSATESRNWSYGEYEIVGRLLRAIRRRYSPETGSFEDCESFELELTDSDGPPGRSDRERR